MKKNLAQGGEHFKKNDERSTKFAGGNARLPKIFQTSNLEIHYGAGWRNFKKLPSRASEKTVQQIFQEAQKSARKSSEKLRQKAPPQVQNALPSGASFFILTIILIFGGVGIAALLAPILVPIVILCAIAGMSFNDD